MKIYVTYPIDITYHKYHTDDMTKGRKTIQTYIDLSADDYRTLTVAARRAGKSIARYLAELAQHSIEQERRNTKQPRE